MATEPIGQNELFFTHSEDRVPCERKLPCITPNQLRHAGRGLADSNLCFSSFLEKKTWCSPEIPGARTNECSADRFFACLGKRFHQLLTAETLVQTIEHAAQGVGFIGEKASPQDPSFLRRTGSYSERKGVSCTGGARAPVVLYAQRRLGSVRKEAPLLHTKST